MKVRIGIAAIVVAISGFALLKKATNQTSAASHIRARLMDVRALPVGAPVTLAGLPVGAIVKRRVGSGYAEIDIEFSSEIDLRKDATLFKRRISLLSGPSLEIDPGMSDEKLSGRYIERVVETNPIGDVLYEVSEALPQLREGAADGVYRAEKMRARVNGPFREQLEQFDEAAEDIARRMHHSLGKMNDALKRGEDIHFVPRESIEPFFTRSDQLTRKAHDSLGRAREWMVRSATRARKKVEETSVDWSEFSGPTASVDDGNGTLGTLLNNDELHEDIVQITNDTRSFVKSVVHWKMNVGLKTEFGINAREPTGYVTIKAGREDRFYYIEVVGSPRGGAPEASVAYDQTSDSWVREIQIRDSFRITAQYAAKVGPATLRYGFKESTFGAGADVDLIDDRLVVSADIFEFGVADLPRVKLAASLRLFGQLYMLAGLDDALNPGRTIDTSGANDTNGLSELYLGRDLYFGARLQFSDRDLGMLLRIGSTALGALVL
ncbi:MAG: MCE family protein [Myxococcales bacterium]|nr:MCE family protein [Myxococcales bacterium]